MARHKMNGRNEISDTWELPDMTGWSCAEVACALKNMNQEYEVKFIDDKSMQHNVVVKHDQQSMLGIKR